MIPPKVATLATLLGVPLAIGLHAAVGWTWYIPVLAALWVIGVPICARSALLLGIDDPSEVTYDEVTSLPLVYFLAPSVSWQILLAGFFLHRFFDILKPLGVAKLDALHGGVGVMADDVLASIYALAVLQLLVALGWIA
jgi:phosphatidylglycerophosphatase A